MTVYEVIKDCGGTYLRRGICSFAFIGNAADFSNDIKMPTFFKIEISLVPCCALE